MNFPKTIPLPDFPIRCKEWQLLGYEVFEIKGRTMVLREGSDDIMVPMAMYRNKRNKKYYLDKRFMEWCPISRCMLEEVKKGKLVNSIPEQLWWNSLRR